MVHQRVSPPLITLGPRESRTRSQHRPFSDRTRSPTRRDGDFARAYESRVFVKKITRRADKVGLGCLPSAASIRFLSISPVTVSFKLDSLATNVELRLARCLAVAGHCWLRLANLRLDPGCCAPSGCLPPLRLLRFYPSPVSSRFYFPFY